MFGLSQDELTDLVLSVGTRKATRRLSPMEVVRLIERALQVTTRKRLAKHLHIDTAIVARFVRLLRLPKEYQYLLNWHGGPGRIPFSIAAEAAQLTSSEDVSAVLDAVMERQLTRLETLAVVQLRQRSGKRIAECIADIVGMRPVVVLRHVLVGTIADRQLRRKLGALRASRRQAVLRSALQELYADAKILAARLGTKGFTIVTTPDSAQRILQMHNHEPGEVNAAILAQIVKEIGDIEGK